jgi:hypothetical protein
VAAQPSAVPDEIRIPRKIVRMVAELHVRGYQWLRLVPFIYDLGSWRGGITPVSNILARHGAMAADYDQAILPQYTSASMREYFGWKDARHATPSQLAELFIERFPRVAREGYGSDWMYAGWYSEMLHLTHPGTLPIAYGNMSGPSETQMLWVGEPPVRSIPLPPPGWVRDGAR